MSGALKGVFVALLSIAAAACATVGEEGGGGSGGTAGSGGTTGTGGSGGTNGTGGSGGSGGNGSTGPKVTLTAAPSDVTESGGSAELVWVVSDAESCEARDGWAGLRNAQGGSEVRPIFDTKHFEIACTGPGGTAVDDTTVELSGSPLQVTINMNYYLVLVGDTFNVNVTVANPSDSAASGVATTLSIPEYVIIKQADLQDAICTDNDMDGVCDSGTNIQFNMIDVGAGELREFSLSPEVAPGAEGKPLRFRAEASSGTTTATPFEETAEEGQSPLDLFDLAQSPDKPQAGDVIVYSLSYQAGAELLEGALLTLTLPKYTTLAGTPSGNATVVDGTVTWNLGDLMPGDSGLVQASADVDPFLPSGVPLRAKAELEATQNGEVVRTRATTQAQLSSGPLTLSAILTPNRVGTNDRMDLAVTISNPAQAPLTDLEVRVLIPPGIDWFYANEMVPVGVCPPSNSSCYSGETAIWSGLSLAPGQSRTLWINFLSSSGVPLDSQISFPVSVEQAGEKLAESVATAAKKDRVLDLRLSEASAPVRPGEHLTYALDFANQSGATILDGSVSLRIPSGTALLEASGDGHVNADGDIEWSLNGLAKEQTGTRYAVVRVSDLAAEGSQLRASVSGFISGSQVASASRSTTVGRDPLVATVQINPDRVRSLERTEVAVTVKNVSSAPVTEMQIGLRIPPGIVWFNVDKLSKGAICPPSDGSCYAGETAFWKDLSLEPGDSITVTGVPYMNSGMEGSLAPFDAIVTAGNGSSALASATTHVDDGSFMELRLFESAHPVVPGASLTYTLYFTNKSEVTRNGVLSITIPEGATFTHASNDGQQTGRVVQWPLNQLGPGEGGARKLTVQVGTNPELLPDLLRVDARLTVDDDPRIARATSNTPVGSRSLIASVEVASEPLKASERVDVAVTVSNPSPNQVNEVDVRLRLPQGINWFYTTELSGSGICPPSNGSCYGGEAAIWSGLRLRPKESVILTLAPVVMGDFLGTRELLDALMPFSLEVTATGEQTLFAGAAAVADGDREIQIRLTEDANPVYPGATLTYLLHYGNLESYTIKQTLRVKIPDGTRLLSATNMGTDVGSGLIEWNPMDVPGGGGGTEEVQVELVSGQNLPGSQLRAEAEAAILENGQEAVGRTARASAVTPVGEDPLTTPLELHLAAPATSSPKEQVMVNVTVSNTGSSVVNNVSVRVRLPQHLQWFYTSVLSHPAICPPSDGSCYSGETVIFDDVSLGAQESVTFTIPAFIAAGVTEGTLITFSAEAVVPNGTLPLPHAAGTVRICSACSSQ